MKKQHYLYVSTNIVNGKKYVGQHVTDLETVEQMLKDRYLGSGNLLIKSIKKHGRKKFKKEIIAVYKTQKEVDKAEIDFIKNNYVLENKDTWYNRGSGGQFGRTEQHRELTSKAMKKVWRQPEYREMLIASGRLKSEEQKEKENLPGMRKYLIDKLRWVKNLKIKEWEKSEEGIVFKKEYESECFKMAIAIVNEQQRTPEARKRMSETCLVRNRKGIRQPHEAKIAMAKSKISGNNTWLAMYLINNNIIPGSFCGRIMRFYTNGHYKTMDGLKKACNKLHEKLKDYNLDVKIDALVSLYMEAYHERIVKKNVA